MYSARFRACCAAVLLCATQLGWAASPVLDEAQALVNQGQYQQALARLDAHLEKVPQDAEARFLRGLVLVRLGRTDDAIRAFAELTRDYPQLPEPYNNLAVLYAQKGEYEKARDALEAALATHPSYATAHENLGDIYAALASAAYNRALALDEGNTVVRRKLRLMEQIDSLPEDMGPGTPPPAAPPAREPAPPATAEPAPKPVPPVFSEADRRAVLAAVDAWARAWSAQDVDAYLATYADDFVPDGGMSRSAWAELRRQRLTAPSFIRVQVLDPEVEPLGPDRVRVRFRQVYESDTYSDRVTKVLELRRDATGWRIVREVSG